MYEYLSIIIKVIYTMCIVWHNRSRERGRHHRHFRRHHHTVHCRHCCSCHCSQAMFRCHEVEPYGFCQTLWPRCKNVSKMVSWLRRSWPSWHIYFKCKNRSQLGWQDSHNVFVVMVTGCGVAMVTGMHHHGSRIDALSWQQGVKVSSAGSEEECQSWFHGGVWASNTPTVCVWLEHFVSKESVLELLFAMFEHHMQVYKGVEASKAHGQVNEHEIKDNTTLGEQVVIYMSADTSFTSTPTLFNIYFYGWLGVHHSTSYQSKWPLEIAFWIEWISKMAKYLIKIQFICVFISVF